MPCWWLALLLLTAYARVAGACADLTQAPHSRWQVMVQDGVHWLVTPCGQPFFSIGINTMDGGHSSRIIGDRLAYHWGTFYPDLDVWAQQTRKRVLDWGFNSAGGWSLAPSMLRLPSIPYLELGQMAKFHWYDPFHPSTTERMHAWAHRLVAPYKNNPYRIGYFIDNEVGWWNGALLNYYIKQPPTNHTKQRLIALLREHYSDDWQAFTRDFVPPAGLSSFAHLLHNKGTSPQLRPGGSGIRVIRRWTGMVAEHYYRTAHQAMREADPDGLIFGDRLPIYYDPVAVRAMFPYVDVISTNYNVDSPDGWIAQYFFDGLRQLTGNKPLLISEWFFSAHENRTGNRNNTHLMTVATQAERARGAAAATMQFARRAEIVGIHWFQYYDHPRGGRPTDGEDHNFGLVDIDDRPYEDLVEALSRANRRVAEIHRQARAAPRVGHDRPLHIPKADIDARDRSLAEWPKEHALVPTLIPSTGEVAFGDLYLAWDARGLHLALIGMDYYDPDLLAYDGEFPREEAFRVDWGLETDAEPHRFALYIIPPKFPADTITARMHSLLCRPKGGLCKPVPSAVATYFGSDQPRITVEVTLPWKELGLTGPPAHRQVRVELAATAWHRSRWMSMSGLPPELAMQDPSRWAVATLGAAMPPSQP